MRATPIMCLLACMCAPAIADGYWGAHRQGWFWYIDPAARLSAMPDPGAGPDPGDGFAPAAEEEPSEVAAHRALRLRLETLRSVAIMSPSRASIRAYLVVQKEALDRSSLFADIWQRVVWANPELDYSLRHRPTNAVALRTHEAHAIRGRGELLAAASANHGLFFLFGTGCEHCDQMGAVVRRFAARHGMSVRAVALGGAASNQFPDAWSDNGFAAALGADALPALYLARLDRGGGTVEPVAFGPLSDEELAERVAVLVGTRPGERF